MILDTDIQWINEHQNVNFKAEQVFTLTVEDDAGNEIDDLKARWKKSIADIQTILGNAATAGKKVRAVGSRWSLSQVGVNPEIILNTTPLNIIIFSPQIVPENGPSKGFVLTQCGALVSELNAALAEQKMALSTSGASDGQTIAGAVSTGTHGSAKDFGAMQDYVKGLHIITSKNEHFWIEPNEKYLSDAYLAENFDNIERKNDDLLFNAALVSFGSFGVIHALLLKCEPLYYFEYYQKTVDWDFVKDSVSGPKDIDFLHINSKPFHLEFLVNPYKDVENVILKSLFRRDFNPAVLDIPPITLEDRIISNFNSDALNLIGNINSKIPSTTKLILKILDGQIKGKYPDFTGEPTFPFQVFGGSNLDRHTKGMSVEIGVDANQAQQVAEIVFEEAQNRPFVGLVALRYVKQSRATLAFTKFPITCAIELPSLSSPKTEVFYQNLFDRLDTEGIPFTSHWGQMSDLNEERLRRRWGNDGVNSWLEARHQILKTQAQRDMFSNEFLEQCGLNKPIV